MLRSLIRGVERGFRCATPLLAEVGVTSVANERAMQFAPEDVEFVTEGNLKLYTAGSDDLETSLLASRLLELDGVKRVLFTPDGVAVTAQSARKWKALHEDVSGVISDMIDSGEECILADIQRDDVDVLIPELLDTFVRPLLQRDGGEIDYLGHDPEDGIVFVQFQGQCAGCAMKTFTLENLVFDFLEHYLPNDVLDIKEGPRES